MAKDPVLPLYYNDLTASTLDWTDEEFGAYVRLLIHQWRQGGIPKDYQRLTRIATSLDKNWSMLQTKFEEVDGILKNKVMEDIRTKRTKHKQKQKENISKRYQNSTKQSTKHIPLEDEYEKEKEELNNKEAEEFFEPLSDQWFDNAFDSIHLEKLHSVYRVIDVPDQLEKFKLKVRGAPEEYQHRSTGSIRLAFDYQLRNCKPEKLNGTPKDKSTEHLGGLVEGFKLRNAKPVG